MNIFDYIKDYGEYSFIESNFNEIDNVILSCISYIDLSDIVSNNKKNKLTLKEVGQRFFETYNPKNKKEYIGEVKFGIKLLETVMKKKRYQNILVYNYEYVFSSKCQFGAMTFDLANNLIYVAFEGTDHLLSGWVEDYEISYKFPVGAQALAIKYLNHNFCFSHKKLIIGGHSKGGCLAITAAMKSSILVKYKIKQIYSNDGLGLREREYLSKKYKKIEPKIHLLVADYSVVPFLLYNKTNYLVVKTNKKSLIAHDPIYWMVEENHFVRGNVSKSSRVLALAIREWTKQFSIEEKQEFIDEVLNHFHKHSIESFLDLKKNKKLILKIIVDSKNISEKTKKMFISLYQIIINSIKNQKDEELNNL